MAGPLSDEERAIGIAEAIARTRVPADVEWTPAHEAVAHAVCAGPDGQDWLEARVNAVHVLEHLTDEGWAVVKLDTPHVAVFTEDRWLIEHSARCRIEGTMADCPYHAAVALIADDMRDDLGRYVITGIDSEGLPSLEAEMV